MPSLSSLIVQRQVATIAEVEQAIARQVIHGGDFLTNLLEVAPHAERNVNSVFGESLGLPAASPGRLPPPEDEALELVPMELALRAVMLPIRLRDGELLLAVSDILRPLFEEELRAAGIAKLSLIAAPLIRIREGIAAHYGAPLDARQLRLVDLLEASLKRAPEPRIAPAKQAFPETDLHLPTGLKSGISQRPPPVEASPPTRRKPSRELAALRAASIASEEVAARVVAEQAARAPVAEEDAGWSDPAPVGDIAQAVVPPAPAMPSFAPAVPPPAAEPEPLAAEEPLQAMQPASEEPPALLLEAASSAEALESARLQAVAFEEAALAYESDLPVSGRLTVAHEAPAPPLARRSDQAPLPEVVEAANVQPEVESPPEVESEDFAATISEAPSTEAEPSLPQASEERLVSVIAENPVEDASPRPPGMIDKRALHSLLRREVGSKKVRAKTARRKGPFSRSEAERELETARTPDDILDIFFAFGSQFFEYAALFVAHGDLLEGRDAWGPGADHLRVLGLGVPLDLPSSLAAVRGNGQVLLSRFDDHEIDREFRRDLERSPRKPSLAALVPVTIRSRAVGILYGDDGDQDVTLGSLGELLGFCALASTHVERLLRAKKGKTGAMPRAQPHSVAALARALDLPGAEIKTAPLATSHPAPGRESRVSPGAASVLPPAPPPRAEYEPPPRAEYEPSGRSDTLDYAELSAPNRAPLMPRFPSSIPAQEAFDAAPLTVPTAAAPDFDAGLRPDPLAPTALGEAGPISKRVIATPLPAPHADSSAEHERFSSSSATGPSSKQVRFVRPIPREEDDDVSDVVASNSSAGETPMRHSVEPDYADGRIGSYHIIPRPAEARRRPELTDIDALLHRALVGGLEGEEAIGELLALPDTDVPKLLAKFPGPLSVDRLRSRADIPPASECGPLLKVVGVLRRAALPFVTVRSASSDLEQRFWATHILGELLYPEASSAILPRLFDDDVAVRRVARRTAQALVAAGAPGEPLTQSLDHTMRNAEEPMHRRLLAVEALVDIRVPLVVPILIGGLRDPSDTVVEAARTGLIVVARQDLGRIADVWHAWWVAHKDQHRIEWLIDALTHETHSIRRAAGEELKLLTREYFGYYDDLPPRERERAQERYRQWWSDDGMYRFR